MFGRDHPVGVGAAGDQPLLQPVEAAAGERIAVAQPVEKLGGEGILGGAGLGPGEDLRPRPLADQQFVGQCIGRRPVAARPLHPVRQPAQVFQQDEAQERRHRPDLADVQRPAALVALHHGGEIGQVEGGIPDGDELPSQRQHPRHRSAVGQRHLRQVAVEARREVTAQVAEVLLHHVMVVEQPFRRRGDQGLVARRRLDGKVVGQDGGLVVLHPREDVEGAKLRQGGPRARQLLPRPAQRGPGPERDADRRGGRVRCHAGASCGQGRRGTVARCRGRPCGAATRAVSSVPAGAVTGCGAVAGRPAQGPAGAVAGCEMVAGQPAHGQAGAVAGCKAAA